MASPFSVVRPRFEQSNFLSCLPAAFLAKVHSHGESDGQPHGMKLQR